MDGAVGADIESLCSKCGDVWHVVVARVGTRIAKVQCKQCGGLHRYRPPHPLPESTAAPRAPRQKAASTRVRGTERPAVPATVEGPRVAVDPTRPPRPYRTADTYQVGDEVVHATFGRGIVESVPTKGRIEVFFATGRRVLAHAQVQAEAQPGPPKRHSFLGQNSQADDDEA